MNTIIIPEDFPVQPIGPDAVPDAKDPAGCGTCHLLWDDGISTSLTPVPSGRCPFEIFHEEEEEEIDTRPILDLERNNAGRLHIGVTELDERGYGVRAYVLSMQDEHTADVVMERRFADMLRLMGNNVQTRD